MYRRLNWRRLCCSLKNTPEFWLFKRLTIATSAIPILAYIFLLLIFGLAIIPAIIKSVTIAPPDCTYNEEANRNALIHNVCFIISQHQNDFLFLRDKLQWDQIVTQELFATTYISQTKSAQRFIIFQPLNLIQIDAESLIHIADSNKSFIEGGSHN